jgi:hypothetical protein
LPTFDKKMVKEEKFIGDLNFPVGNGKDLMNGHRY